MADRKDKPDLPPKPEKRKVEPKPSSMIGDRMRAGTLLSTHLRRIAQEETEFLDLPDGGRMGTKAEALARLMFKLALGYEERDADTNVVTKHGPDRGMLGLIWDRIEGRAAPITDNAAKKRTLPNRVSDENTKRLNDMVTGDNAD